MRVSAASVRLTALLACLLFAVTWAARPVSQLEVARMAAAESGKHKKPHHKPKHPFRVPVGYFIQERASKQLPGPGQHFQFGALKSWDSIMETVMSTPDAKLVLFVRHGQAYSNWLQDSLGPDVWFDVELKCTYDDKNGTVYGIFDAELTDLGQDQGRYLNSILAGGGWFEKITGNQSVRAVVSPLSRCLQTALLVRENLPIQSWSVEEGVRETLGEDTCDARRSVTDPGDALTHRGPCAFQQGLRSKFPEFEFEVASPEGGLGLISDQDELWTKDRETQKQQVKRATRFLYNLWDHAPEKVVVVFTHSGFTRSVLLAAGREPYRPQNTELVPAIIFKTPVADEDDEALSRALYADMQSTDAADAEADTDSMADSVDGAAQAQHAD